MRWPDKPTKPDSRPTVGRWGNWQEMAAGRPTPTALYRAVGLSVGRPPTPQQWKRGSEGAATTAFPSAYETGPSRRWPTDGTRKPRHFHFARRIPKRDSRLR